MNEQKFDVLVCLENRRETLPARSLAAAHALLGQIAGEHDLNLHIHEGPWAENCYSTAYWGTDPVFNIRAYVRLSSRS